MTPPDHNSIDVNGLLTTIGAIVTLASTVLALLPFWINREVKITAPVDPFIKAIEIKRKEIDPSLWKKRRFRIRLSYILFVFAFIAETGLIVGYFFLPFSSSSSSLGYIVGYFFFLFIYPLTPFCYIRPYFELKFKSATDARFYIFQNIEIFVEGNIEYIFSKAQEALRGKMTQYIDVDFNARKLETSLKWSFKKAPAKVTVVMEIVNAHANCYSLTVNYERANKLPKWIGYFWYEMSARDIFSLIERALFCIFPLALFDLPGTIQLTDIDARSTFINQFIGKLLTKEAAGEKSH